MEMASFGAALEEQKKIEGWIEDIVEILLSSFWIVARLASI
jgi:hypothetical protein